MKSVKLLCFFMVPILGSCGNKDLSLKQIYGQAFMIGTEVNRQIVTGRDSLSAAIVVSEFNAVSPENDMKAEVINPRPGVWNFAPADAYVQFGNDNGMFVLGHTLVWHNQTPSWFFQNDEGEPNTHDQQVEQMRSYIEHVAGRYKGKVDAWDVVNEIIDNDGSYRNTVWVKSIGDGYEVVKLAFTFANRYAPDTELYYNDFNAWRPSKRDGIISMVRQLQKDGVRIDGIGIQGHWGLNYPRMEYIEAAIDSFASLGVKVMITELDIDVLPLTKEGQIIGQGMSDPQFQLEEFKEFFDPYRDGLPENVEKEQAERYAQLFRLFYEKRDKIDRVTLWGVHDGMSWKNGYPIPGRTNYPLVWDRNRKPKLALKAIKNMP